MGTDTCKYDLHSGSNTCCFSVFYTLITSVSDCVLCLVYYYRYKNMESCITPPGESAQLKKFPERLSAIPPRILEGHAPGVTEEDYEEDNKLWKKHVNTYKRVNKLIGSSRYRNIMDMNAGLGSFAAALDSPMSWVMNVVPTISENNTLGIIYERGLIGIYHDW